ncbi:MAG: sn stearoyl-lipid 9-desaturase [Sphingomonadales bacterium]|jgi:stearoyl-CoA desaturase (delta-9 desaturase)|nr:sn stearoyl-lipid 9-desaturase [Sphingomonadales bacterium]
MKVAGEASEGAFKVNSLAGLEEADAGSGRLEWDAPRSIWNMGFIAAALVLGPLYFSWSGLIVFLLLSGFTLCVGHSVGFHRRLIHRSFECPKWLERAMIYVGVLVGMGGPLWTVGLHDIRDWAQRQANCHWFLRHGKPVLLDGFYYLNFKLRFERPPRFDAGEGISDDPFYVFLQRTWMLHQIPIALLLYALGGWPWVVWGVIVRVAVCFTMHWYIAHVAHRRGHQDWFVEDAAVQGYNIAWLAIPTMGESWHCNHHAFPASARHGLYPGQADPGFRFVRLLQWLGLAWDVQVPAVLPPRSAITPLTARALSIAAPGQAELSRAWAGSAAG